MIRPQLFILFILLFRFGPFAFSESITQPHVYKVEKNGNASYLFGTYHHGISTSELPAWVMEIHKKTKIHAYEVLNEDFEKFRAYQNISLNPEDPAAARAFMMQMGFGSSRPELSPSEIELAVRMGIPRSVAKLMPRNSCAIFAAKPFIFDRTYRSLDSELSVLSGLTGKKTVALEDQNIRAQAVQLDQDDSNDSECDVGQILAHPEDLLFSESLSLEIETMYRSGRDLEFASSKGLIFRTRAWMPKILVLAGEGNSFITVGYAHLPGPDGILQLLKNEGFRVERLTSAPGKYSLRPDLNPYR